jgi:CheY-like chemotaxis protein
VEFFLDCIVSSTAQHRPAVLVVDDQLIVRAAMAATLANAGYRVLEAASADEALVLLGQDSEVEALVTDVNMPGSSMDGLELARHVREKWPRMKVVVVSGTISAEHQGIPAGAVFVPKSLITSRAFIEQVSA